MSESLYLLGFGGSPAQLILVRPGGLPPSSLSDGWSIESSTFNLAIGLRQDSGVDYFDAFPSGLIDLLCRRIPRFAALSPRHRVNIAKMLWDFTSGRYRHRNGTGAAFSVTYNESVWGSRRTRNKVVKEYFDVIQGSNVDHQFSAFEPYDFLGEVLLEFLHDPKPIDLLKDGKRMSLPKKAILSRAAADHASNAKHSVWDVYPSPKLPINEHTLVEFSKVTSDRLHGLNALRLARLARNSLWPGEIPLLYEQKSTGRLTEVLWGFQSTPREVVSAALTGFWDYDLQNAHFSIFSAWAKRLGLKTPLIDEYIANKHQIRNDLGTECKAGLDAIKECLIALMYGAPLSTNPDFAAIPRVLGTEAARRFTSNPFVYSLKREIAGVGKHIVNDLPTHRGQYGNAVGVYVPKPDVRSIMFPLLCHALQGVEALALKAVVEQYEEDILLCMHDGWVARRQLSNSHLEELIFHATGFELSLEEQMLPKYLPQPGGAMGWTFADSTSLTNPGLLVSASPQWSVSGGVHGRVTRTDLLTMPRPKG